ncbi:MAG TPA: hypothetical protein VFT05_11115, partial [Burkholderiaceae bacterium]|nr:hypothetical protein [Burkholderiaceae bacterium]
MSTPIPLLVPLTVEAFVVNDHVRLSGKPFMRTQMSYNSLQQCANAQASFGGNDWAFTQASAVPPNNVSASSYYNGVYLKWRLPAALTCGAHDPVAGQTVYPLVPNRWLIVRLSGALSGRQAAAWIVESDYRWDQPPNAATIAQTASLYVGLEAESGNTPVGIYIGRNVALGSWVESGASLHLTAVAPGNPAFACYQPQNNNVFSFVDCLDKAPDDTLSYQVLGWYSDAQDDPLAGVGAEDFSAVLKNLDWALPAHTDPSLNAGMTLLTGSACGVQWQTQVAPAGGAPEATSPVSISVGNSSVEALTAMVVAQAAHLGVSVDADLLEAFQLNLLDVLDGPDGAAVLADKLHTSFFQRYAGGYSWTLVDAPDSKEPVTDAEWAIEQAWLAELSKDQAALDTALRDLVSLQHALYVAWWKYASWPSAYTGSTSISGLEDQDNLWSQVDPGAAGSLGRQVAAQLRIVQALAALVPDGDTPELLQAAIVRYAAGRTLPDSRVLKRSAAAPFYLPNNPVVLISGAGASGIVDPSGATICRFPSQLVTGFELSGVSVNAATPGLAIPRPGLSGVSGVPWTQGLVAQLVEEFFLTDPSNAVAISALIPGSTVPAVQGAMADPANFTGVYPAGAVQLWSQNPWHPLLLLWQASYYPIAYGTPATPNWSFEDGRYLWTGAADSVEQMTSLSGLIQLSPTVAFNMQARIKAYLQNNPYLDPEEAAAFNDLLEFVRVNDNWDLLSQSLNGFNEQLRLGMAGVFLAPDSVGPATTPPLSALIGDVGGYPPGLSAIPTGTTAPSGFQPWRSGQFIFTNLVLVDEWGQALWPIDQQTQPTETVYLPPDLLPVRTSNAVDFPVTATALSALPAAAAPILPAASGPLITRLSPDLLQAGMAPGALVPVIVTGSGFGRDSVVTWNGVPVNIVIVSEHEIHAGVLANFVMEAGVYAVAVSSGGVSSAAAFFTVSAGPVIAALEPASIVADGPAFTLIATGVGFEPHSMLAWNGHALDTTFVSATQLTAQVPESKIIVAQTAVVTQVVGHLAVPDGAGSYIQLPPALLQPARLDFRLLSASDDGVEFGPAQPTADPVCGWLLPNHLDASLMAYDAEGCGLGEMSIGVDVADQPAVFWTPAPGSTYSSLEKIAVAITHFGPFLLTLFRQGPGAVTAFLQAIDETLWTTAPLGAVFDQDLAVLMGRPLAMVRAQLQFELDGAPYADPSWQYTFNPAAPAVSGYRFPIELGNVARLNDGLIGYFMEDDYSRFNVVQQAVSGASAYLAPIGEDNNYIDLPFDGTAARVSMLIDPRAVVHATTALLPTVELSLPPQFVTNALAAMDVTFRVGGALTDQTTSAAGKITILLPVPKEKA